MEKAPGDGGAAAGRGAGGAGAPGDSPPERPCGFLGSLRFKLILLVVLATGPALGVVLHAGLEERKQALEAADEEALRAARAAARVEEKSFDEARQFLNAIALFPAVRDMDVPSCRALFPQVLAREGRFRDLGLVGADGVLLAAAPERPAGAGGQDLTFFQRALQTKRFAVGLAVPDAAGRRPALHAGHPILDAGGAVRGVLFASMDLDPLSAVLPRIPLPAGSIVVVFDAAGRVLARWPEDPGTVAGAGAGGAQRLLETVRSEGSAAVAGNDGVVRRMGFKGLSSGGEPTGATVAVGIPERAATLRADADLLRNLGLVGCVALLAILAAWTFGSYFILDRVDGLLRATRRISTGGGRARRGPRGKGGGELGQLERAFDTMALSLEMRTDELRTAEARYRELVEFIPAVFYLSETGAAGRVEYVSPQIEQLTGYGTSDWISLPGLWDSLIDPEDRPRVTARMEEALGRGGGYEIEYRMRRKDGTPVWVRDTGFVVALGGEAQGRRRNRGFIVDVSDRKVLEQQFLQAQKMEALGRLSATVAHDFNNLLTVITGYAQLLQLRAGQERAVVTQLDEIVRAADRASVLTRQLLSFSRRQGADPVVVDLNETIATLDRMIRRLIGERIRVQTDPGAGLHRVKIDRGHVDQVLMNLAVNARDAMPEGGTIRIATANVALDDEYARRHVDARPGQYVCLSFADTGTGMDGATMEHLFEPFFTTKGEGKGTGLGLSTVYGIVRQAGGHIEVSSAVGRGTTFRIYLPRHEGPEGTEARGAAGPGAGHTASLAILLVEDDPAIRGFTRQCLETDGHRVTEASSAEEARRIVAAGEKPVEVVVVDVGLPDGDGGKLAKELVAARPGLRAVVMSGFSRSVLREEGREDGQFLFLQKPFRPADLRGALGKVAAEARGK
jgi:PAS domain S-box-containing protein